MYLKNRTPTLPVHKMFLSKNADTYILNKGQRTTVEKERIEIYFVCPHPPPPRLETEFIIRSTAVTALRL